MGSNEVKLISTVDSGGAVTGLKTATGELLKFGNAAAKTSGDIGGITAAGGKLESCISSLALRYLSLYAIANKAIASISASLSFLSQIETATLGIAASYVMNGRYIDEASGKALSAQDALSAAQLEAKTMMQELQVANFKTIATLDQLVRAYQETLPVAMSKGFNREQVKEFTTAVVRQRVRSDCLSICFKRRHGLF